MSGKPLLRDEDYFELGYFLETALSIATVAMARAELVQAIENPALDPKEKHNARLVIEGMDTAISESTK